VLAAVMVLNSSGPLKRAVAEADEWREIVLVAAEMLR